MAEKTRKSQAEKAASAAKAQNKKKNNKKAVSVSNTTKNKTAQETSKAKTREIPIRLISSIVFLALFVVFMVAFFLPEGYVIALLSDLIYGLISKTGFVVAIPVLIYLFVIHAFSGNRPVRMRTMCLASFIILCGCISHLVLNPQGLPEDVFPLLYELYIGGIDGTTGGLLCGSFAMLIKLLCGTVISYIILIVAALFSLLGGMQITIPSIIRAVQNRPRSQWEDEPKEERPEPAAVVVNHIANKRIAYMERRRQQVEEPDEEKYEVPVVTVQTQPKVTDNHKADAILRQIDGDVEDPVAIASASASTGSASDPEIIPAAMRKNKPIPAEMPPFVQNEGLQDAPILEQQPQAIKKEKVTSKDATDSAAEVALEIEQNEAAQKPVYCFPPIDLLTPSGGNASDGTAEMRENSRRLNETLASFKIEAHIINVTRGPSVTRYEVELEKGVRLNKLTTAADDIALSLGATGVRIAAVPGKISVVGIEVPNHAVTTVSLREVIDSQDFNKAKSKSSFAVGKDIGGSCIVGNIAKLPHMLIAGTTGSGKSVCMNSIIISLLYKASPDDVKLIMVDPKMVELGIYNGIPHLLIPVVTDPKKAAGSLQWAVTEMMRRYKAMSDAGVRDLESYNSIIDSQEVDGSKLPQIVVIIDELADLMLVAAKEVEESICRIAQMGRAAGIHLIIATQRPSADVITGLMKANIPSRIAFAVASAMESRIILDTQGAEKLVGKGDMLYAPIGNGKPKRVQGCFVSDSEVEAVASYVKSNYVTDYDQQVIEEIEKKALQTGNKTSQTEPEPNSDELAGDEMLPAAVDVILETGQASVSMLQRRLKLGYARAARIVDEMEERGIVGPFVGSKPRAILITKEQWDNMRSGQTAQLGFNDLEDSTDHFSANNSID